MLRPEDMVRVKRTLAWLTIGSVLVVLVAGGLVWALGGSETPEPAGGETTAAETEDEGRTEPGADASPETVATGPAGEDAGPSVESAAESGTGGGWAEEYEHTPTGNVVDTSPVSYDRTDEGQLVMRFFNLLARAEKVDDEWVIPVDEYGEIMEIREENWPFVTANLALFRRTVMERGPWELVGVPVPGAITSKRTMSGREIHRREVSVLVRSEGTDGSENYYQVFLDADFVRYLDGRLALSEAETRVSEINRLPADEVADYLTAYGAE